MLLTARCLRSVAGQWRPGPGPPTRCTAAAAAAAAAAASPPPPLGHKGPALSTRMLRTAREAGERELREALQQQGQGQGGGGGGAGADRAAPLTEPPRPPTSPSSSLPPGRPPPAPPPDEHDLALSYEGDAAAAARLLLPMLSGELPPWIGLAGYRARSEADIRCRWGAEGGPEEDETLPGAGADEGGGAVEGYAIVAGAGAGRGAPLASPSTSAPCWRQPRVPPPAGSPAASAVAAASTSAEAPSPRPPVAIRSLVAAGRAVLREADPRAKVGRLHGGKGERG